MFSDRCCGALMGKPINELATVYAKRYPSVIFLPLGGSGQFADFAARVRSTDDPKDFSEIVSIQHSHAERTDNGATHLALEVLGGDSVYLPLVMVPLGAFSKGVPLDDASPPYPSFRLAWHGIPPSAYGAELARRFHSANQGSDDGKIKLK
jgi:hypothetical protein